MRKFISILCFLLLASSTSAQVYVEKADNEWLLFVDNKPYEIKGATFGFVDDVNNYDTHFQDLQFIGVNTIRTWASGANTQALLDAAAKHNIKVMMGIWMRHGRPGMEDDDRFDYLTDEAGKEAMFNNAIQVVEAYKDHPAVLTWGIGNEVYLNMATDEEKLVYSQLLESICKQIKTIDPNHPITSIEAWTFGLDWWEEYVPSLDIYGLNSYGPGANYLQEELDKRGIDKPYILTEFGVTGEWDIDQKIHGIVVEPDDKQKYEAITTGYTDWIANKPSNLGVFMFHYSSGNKHMAPWLFTHFNGNRRPQYWAIREAFTGLKPQNHVPNITIFEFYAEESNSEVWLPVNLDVTDVENDALDISFAYNQRTGSRKRRDQLNALEFRGNLQTGFEVRLPKEHGGIKVYALVKDETDNMGIASTSIMLTDKQAQQRKYLVPKVELPFYVYKDGEDQPYAASAFMGNYEALEVDTKHTTNAYSGEACMKIAYSDSKGWYGLGLVDPANDWGDILGGYDISGATKITFWARASKTLTAKVGVGLIGKDKPFPDTAKAEKEIKLTTKWKQYSIPLKKLDLSCIRSGFTIFSSAYATGQDIYIDEVRFE